MVTWWRDGSLSNPMEDSTACSTRGSTWLRMFDRSLGPFENMSYRTLL